MKLKYILAVERANLTENDEIRLLDMDGEEYVSETLFKRALKDALTDRTGKAKAIIGTFTDWVKYAREHAHFITEDYITVNVEINY